MIQGSTGIAALILSLVIPSQLLHPTPSAAADLRPETLKAWNSCVEMTERRIGEELSSHRRGFLALDFQSASKSAQERREVLAGQVPIQQVRSQNSDGENIDVPDGMIHHWRGSVLIPGVTLAFVFSRVTNPTREDTHQEDVLDSRILDRAPGELRLFLKLQRSRIITVVYNTEHRVRYQWHGSMHASSSSTATKISEIENLNSDTEREKPEGHDRGFLWKMNSYWRYEEVPGGVIVECESITLSRSIPPLLAYIVRPIIHNVARESMHRTLQSLKSRVLRAHAVQTAASRS